MWQVGQGIEKVGMEEVSVEDIIIIWIFEESPVTLLGPVSNIKNPASCL